MVSTELLDDGATYSELKTLGLYCFFFFFFSLERLEVSFQVRYVHNSYTGEAESSENLSPGIDVSLAVCGLPLQSPCDVSPILVEGAVRRKRWWQRI